MQVHTLYLQNFLQIFESFFVIFMILETGKATEFDKPSRLLERPSLFAALVQEYANRSADI